MAQTQPKLGPTGAKRQAGKGLAVDARQPVLTAMPPDRLPRAPWVVPLVALVLITAGLVVFANGLQGVFLFDDAHAIVENLRIRRLVPLSTLLTTERPVVEISLAVNYAIGSLSVTGYHVVNIVVHLAAALTLFGLIRRTLGLGQTGATAGSLGAPMPLSPSSLRRSVASSLSFSVTLLWLVHPLQTESVTYIIQRAESMMGLFYLLTLYAFARSIPSRRPAWLVVSVMACALAMATKAVAVTAPVVVLLYDRCFVSRSLGTALRARWPYYTGLASTWIVLFLCGIVQHVLWPATDRTAVGFGFQGFSAMQYAMTQPQVILHYLRLAFWPDPLCLDYAWPVVSRVGEAAVSIAAVGGMIVATSWALWRNHWLGFAGAAFFVVLSPTSSVIPVRDVAFEHRMYLPLALVIVVVVAAFASIGRRIGEALRISANARHAVGVVFAVMAAAPLGAAAMDRNRDYRDALAMWQDVAEKRPENARAHVNIGVLLEQRGEIDAAIAAYRKALSIDPDYPDAHFNLGVALLRAQRIPEAEAAFRETLRLSPSDPGAHANLAGILAGRGDLEAAAGEYRAALKVAPQDARSRARLANLLRRLGDLKAAAAEAQAAVQQAPNLPAAHEALAHVFLARGDMASAVTAFKRTIELDPANLPARINLGTALKSEERFAEAAEAYRDALRVDPRSHYAHFHLAGAYMSLGKPEDAIPEFQAALELSPSDAESHIGIGRALQAVGRLNEAAAHFQQALVTDPNRKDVQRALQELGVAPLP